MLKYNVHVHKWGRISQRVYAWQLNACMPDSSTRVRLTAQRVYAWQLNACTPDSSMRVRLTAQRVYAWQLNACTPDSEQSILSSSPTEILTCSVNGVVPIPAQLWLFVLFSCITCSVCVVFMLFLASTTMYSDAFLHLRLHCYYYYFDRHHHVHSVYVQTNYRQTRNKDIDNNTWTG